jgi:hypothetical protein
MMERERHRPVRSLTSFLSGVGAADFGNMNVLDADEGSLNQSGVKAVRGIIDRGEVQSIYLIFLYNIYIDIVQFVPFRKFSSAPLWKLSQEVLAEIPTQVEKHWLRKTRKT